MDPSGMEIPVTLIIKAPNQKYSDQTVSCCLNWTVGALKTHLSKVYPSKPVSVRQLGAVAGRSRVPWAHFPAPGPTPTPTPSGWWTGRSCAFRRRVLCL